MDRKLPVTLVARCPACGLRVLCTDSTRELRHEGPVCETFRQKMAELGMQPRHDRWFAVVPTADKSGE